MIYNCLWYYNICRVVDSNLEVIYSTRIRLCYKTNYYPSNINSRLRLSIIPFYTKLHALRVMNPRYYIISLYPVPLGI